MPVKLSGSELSKYNSTHMWMYRHFGKAIKCEKCTNEKGYRCEWANVSGEYKRDRSDWVELCQSCHKKHDTGDICKRGHPYKDNTLIRNDGNRQCVLCMKIATKKYLLKLKNKKNV